MAHALALLSGPPGIGEMLLVFVAVLVLFGPRRLPGLARYLGRVLEEFRRASQDFRDQLMQADELPDSEPGEDDLRRPDGGESHPNEDAGP